MMPEGKAELRRLLTYAVVFAFLYFLPVGS